LKFYPVVKILRFYADKYIPKQTLCVDSICCF